MNKIRLNHKRLSIWVLLLAQFLLILSYFYLKIEDTIVSNEKVTFIKTNTNKEDKPTYHTVSDKIFLKSIRTSLNFIDFNSSLCYKNGTDLVMMKRSKDTWQCKCLTGWHGKDCGQPEVIWRAFLTYRKPIKIKGPRPFQRRIIYLFYVDEFSETITDMRINELVEVVDLFIINENRGDFLEHKLNNHFIKQHHDKILYLKENRENLWKQVVNTVKNLRDDDIVLMSNRNEIPNKFALSFLKFYDKWPEPIRFRLRWSVFGFFWVHPSKTMITGGACSVVYLKNHLNNRLETLIDNKTLSNPPKGIILGDLNHYGGWFCEYCYDPAQLVTFLVEKPTENSINLEKIDRKIIDSSYVEEIVENGVYIDGTTELIRARKYSDNYFAPFYVLENNWKYDFLLINFYSKLDYYEG